MKKSVRPIACLALILLLAAVPAPAATTARTLYEAAVAREETLRAEVASSARRHTAADYRAAAAAFEAIVRRHHGSGYADNSLWRAAGLLLDAAERFGTTRDRAAAKHLLQRLVAEYPSSRLHKQAAARLAQFESSAAPARADMPVTRTPLALLRGIQRDVRPDLVRVTLELDAEVTYRTERVDNPPRVLFDLAGTMLALTVREGSQRYSEDAVRLVRIGRHPDNTTRIVLDLHGVKDYSVFTLYNPFRIVVDCVREVAATPGSRGNAGVEAAPTEPHPRPVDAEHPTVTPEPARTPPAATVERPASAPPPVSRAAVRPFTYPAGRLRSRALTNRVALAPSVSPTPAAVLWPVLEAAPLGHRAFSWQPANPPRGEPLPPATVEPASPASERERPAVASPALPGDKPVAAEAGANGYSLARQLGLGASRIVLDPGHGGHDPGAQGAGVFESHVVLDVALRLEKLLKSAGVEVIMTRRTDTYIPLEERTAIANRYQGDLFLSIHANASRNRNARGIETYVLNFASNPEAEAVAARENAASGRTMSSLTDIVKAITLNNKLDESRSLAGLVQRELSTRLKASNGALKNLGVKQAPFVVLIGASMPSILVEISFITHRDEGRLLKSGAYRQRVAEALFNGIRGYQKSLKGPVVTASQ